MNTLWLRLQRLYWRRRVRDPALRALLGQSLAFTRLPFPRRRFVVMDLETTALDPQQGEIVSIGWVVIENARIRLDQARHYHLSPTQGVGQSAIFHQLTDSDLEQAHDFPQVMPSLIAALHNSTLVFHNAALDLGFLNRYLRHQAGAPLLVPVLDTLRLEHQRLQRRKAALETGDLRLGTCRHRYGLPDLAAHDALTDALATAELLLAMEV